MPVLPDFLLGGSAATSKASSATPGARAQEARRDDGASFSQVYAKEREARPAARTEAPARPPERPAAERREVRDQRETNEARPARARSAERPAEGRAAAAGNDKEPAVAEDGNVLPPEQSEVVAEAEDAASALGEAVDPTLLLGLGDAATEGDPTATAPQPETVLPLWLTFSPAAASATEPVVEGEADGELTLAPTMSAPEESDGASAELLAEAPDTETADALLAQFAAPEEEPEAEADTAALLDALAEVKVGGGGGQGTDSFKEALVQRLQGLNAPPPAAAAAAKAVPQVPGQALNPQSEGFADGVVDKVMWMSSQNLKSAEIQLDPAELGRMEVRIELVKDQAQVTFVSPHAGVREALEGQMQRLRDLFAQQGMNLADASVADQSQARGWQGQGGEQGSGRGFAGSGPGGAGEEESVRAGVAEIASTRQGGDRGLVDYYA